MHIHKLSERIIIKNITDYTVTYTVSDSVRRNFNIIHTMLNDALKGHDLHIAQGIALWFYSK